MNLRLECVQTGIGTGDNVRHKHDGRFGEVVYVYQATDDNNDPLRFGCAPKWDMMDTFRIFARVEFLIWWLFNGYPVTYRYYEDIETFLLEKAL